VNSVSAADTTDYLVIGSSNTVTLMDNGNAFAVNGTKLDTPKKSNIIQDSDTEKAPFIRLLTFEKNKSVFPVCATWKDVNSFPCRLCGSVYDSTVIIGATEQKGQIDFTESIFVSDTITFTDMLGNCYSYRVEDIKNSNNADYKNLANENSDMVLFIKRTYSQEYLIIECKNT
jgi:hypothetical protein